MQIKHNVPGLLSSDYNDDFLELTSGGNGLWQTGKDGVEQIFTPQDKKVELVCFRDKVLVYVKSALGHPAIYELQPARFEGPATAILMDLDGTSVRSERFWMWIIEQTMARLMGHPDFEVEEADHVHIQGNSVSEHLQYCINKYCPEMKVQDAVKLYHEITHEQMGEIMAGRGRTDAFEPSPGFKEFITEVKARKIKIGLVTSGLYEKAIPEIISVFRQLELGDPFDFYDAIITAGQSLRKGQAGTLGELSAKPHPWLYAEIARVGLHIEEQQRHRVIGIEDSSAGIVSIRLAGFAAIGIAGGNITSSGVRPLVHRQYENLCEALPMIL